MNNIVILRQGLDKIDHEDWILANLVICVNHDGTFELLKNRNGSNGLIGKYGELLDTHTFLENEPKIKVDIC